MTGGASLGKDLGRTFVGLGLNVLQGYGLTETAPVICANRMDDNDPTSVGRPLSGIEVKLGAQNELLTRGPNVMRGYWNNESATAAVIDQDKWLHTGDIADIRNERIYITGRLKEVIVMSNGEKVPPADIEQAILMDPVFEHVMLVGEGRGHMGLLVVSQQQNVEELCRRANAQLHNFPGYAKIFHLACVQEPWTVEDGALTPSMKLKRRVIEQRYAKEIEAMFERKLCD